MRKHEAQTSRHGPSVLIYVLPALIDMVMALVLFVGTVRAVKLGGGATQAATVLAVWSLVYVVACPLIGRLVTAGNARIFILAGCGLFALSSGLLAAATGFVPMLALIGLCGVAAALFFPPFQVFMKAMDSAGGHSVAYSTGLYTFSWSTGFAFGPFIAGFLMQLGVPATAGGEGPGWRYAFLFSAGVCLLTPWVLSLAARNNRDNQPTAHGDAPPSDATRLYESKPDLAWLGWLGAGAGFTALSIIRAVFPVRALGILHLSESALGSVFFVLSMTQALMGLALMRSRFWMYRAKPVGAFALAGMAGILAFGFGKTSAMFLAGAMLFGIYTGAFCFYMVFHALVHPQRAGRYVSVNESLVGITGFLAPLAGGAMADAWGFQFPYLAAAGVTLAAMGIQVWIHGDSKGNA